MTEVWKQWEGQVIDGKFPLRKYLGGSEHSVVFLTEMPDLGIPRAAIKLVPANAANTDSWLSRWTLAANLSHPRLMKLFRMGRCRLDNAWLLYVVMEYAQSNLSDSLSERALTPAEARVLLELTLEALAYVHSKGFVHDHMKPANIMAVGDELKISSDGLCRIEAPCFKPPSRYDPPETAQGVFSAAGDVWSMGITLVEALTQRLPVWQETKEGSPLLADVPAPFDEIASHCLVTRQELRWTIKDIAGYLQRSSLTEQQPNKQVAQQASDEPKQRKQADERLQRQSPKQLEQSPGEQMADLPRPAIAAWLLHHSVPVIAGTFALAGLLGSAILIDHHRKPSDAASNASGNASAPSGNAAGQALSTARMPPTAQPSAARTEPEQQGGRIADASGQSARGNGVNGATDAPSNSQPIDEKNAAASTQAHTRTNDDTSTDRGADRSADRSADRGPGKPVAASTTGVVQGVVTQPVLPDVPQSARNTIQGEVRVSVRVGVDPSGNVTDVALDSAGPSRYFARLALESARKWKFGPATMNGRNVGSEWILRFGFQRGTTTLLPEEVSP